MQWRQDSEALNLRLPDGMRDRIKDSAKSNNRSMNAEAVARLEASFEVEQALAPELARLINQHIQSEVDARLMAIARNLTGVS